MEHNTQTIVVISILVYCVILCDSLTLPQNQNQRLQVLSYYGSRYDEYSATDGSLIGSLDNSILIGPSDIEAHDGKLYVSGFHYKINIYNQTTLEYLGTLVNYTQQVPFSLSFLPPATLAVCLLDQTNFVWSLTFLDINTGESFANMSCPLNCYDVIPHPFNSSKILVATSLGIESYLWDTSSYQFDTLYADFTIVSSGLPQDKVTMQHNGQYLYVAVTSPDMIVYFAPTEDSATFVWVFFTLPNQSDNWNLRSFAFYPNSTSRIIAVGHENGIGYIYDYEKESDNLTLFAQTDLDEGYYVGCTEGVYFDSMGSLYVVDWGWILRFNSSTARFQDQIIHRYGFQYPQGVSYNPLGDPKIAYVSTGNKVLRVDRSTFQIIDNFIPQAIPGASDGQPVASQLIWLNNTLYVAGGSRVVAYSPAGNILGIADTGCPIIIDLKVNPKNGKLYASCFISNTLYEIDATSLSVVITLAFMPSYYNLIAFSLDGNIMYACDSSLFCSGIVAFNSSNWVIQQGSGDVVLSTFGLEVGTDGLVYLMTDSGVFVVNGTSMMGLGYLTSTIPNYHANNSYFSDFYFAPSGLLPSASPNPSQIPSQSASPVSPSASGIASASPNTDTGNKKDKKDNSEAILGGIVGGVGGALLCGALLGFLVVRRKRKNDSDDVNLPERELSMRPASIASSSSTSSSVPNSWHEYWEIDYRELEIGQEIGRGAFGSVFKGEWRNSACVVKQLQVNKLTKEAIDTFLKEANTVKSLRNHGNVCTIFGVTTNPERPICIVMEYCSGGSLQSALSTTKIIPTFQNLIKILRDVTSGMGHVHREGIVHCDLACRNILVSLGNGEFSAKISDFGLAKQIPKESSIQVSDDDIFPIRWSAPELLRDKTLSFPCDVWSFGITMWEIIEGAVPYSQMPNVEVVQYVTDQKYVLPEPKAIASASLPPILYDIMKSCWAYDPSKRPTFGDLNKQFKSLDRDTNLKEAFVSSNPNSNNTWNSNSDATSYSSRTQSSVQTSSSSGLDPYAVLREDKYARYSKISTCRDSNSPQVYGNNFSSSNSE